MTDETKTTTAMSAIKAVLSKTTTAKSFIKSVRRTTGKEYIAFSGGDFRGTMTTTQRDALGYKRVGDVIINTTTGYQEVWEE